MSQAFYYNDGKGQMGCPSSVKYQVYGGPCEMMKYDKVLLIPERINELFPANPNAPLLVVPPEAYIGVPIRDASGKCFALFAAMWSKQGLKELALGWAFIEMMFHALEDILVVGFLDRGRFASSLKTRSSSRAVIPHDAITAAQSLKPYARNLSHELRTPMQGVVGMLDVMYATVQEAAEGQADNQVRAVLDNLRENIEVVQDSSRRAVEAADNVVHAYDMNMGVPETPLSPPDDDEYNAEGRAASRRERRPDIVITGDNVPINFKGHKRRRESRSESRGSFTKRRRAVQPSSSSSATFLYGEVAVDDVATPPASILKSLPESAFDWVSPMTAHLEQSEQASVPPGLRHTNLRDLLQFLINDLLKVGGRPESAIALESEGGEEIEVRIRSQDGKEFTKIIHWSVDPSVPDTILIEEQSLVKVISSVYSNAIKFTDEGNVKVHAHLSARSRYIVIRVKDTGSGIREEFVPRLFQPFSKEDDSLTRKSEGLGLGLMVAKGLARKLGGDLELIKTCTEGSERGTEFEIKIPTSPSDINSRPSTPSAGSPAPSGKSKLLTHEEDGVGRQRTRSGSLRSLLIPRQSKTPPTHHPTPSPPQNYQTRSTAAALQRLVQTPRRTSTQKRTSDFDRNLATKFPLTFLVVEDNKINRKLLVNMLYKLGYKDVHEAYDGSHAVRQMQALGDKVDLILMDLWMPYMDGYEAAEKILSMPWKSVDYSEPRPSRDGAQSGDEGASHFNSKPPTILAVTADVTDGALEKAATAGMKGK